eukprot:Hpha_TRINITY_DN25875_c0_g1::TRINITY_DN25875_c0_g1_i1::g.19938::m.19938
MAKMVERIVQGVKEGDWNTIVPLVAGTFVTVQIVRALVAPAATKAEKREVVLDPEPPSLSSDASPRSAPYLGVHVLANVRHKGASPRQVKNWKGLLVDGVTAGGPAAQAGIRHGDDIVSVNGRSLVSETHGDTLRQWKTVLGSLSAGDTVTLVVARGPTGRGDRITIDVTAQAAPGQMPPNWRGGSEPMTYTGSKG